MIDTEEIEAAVAEGGEPGEFEPVTLREWETRRLELTKRQAGRLAEDAVAVGDT